MVNYNVDAASSGFDQFKRRSTNREVDPVSRSRINKSPLDDDTSSGFDQFNRRKTNQGLGSPTNQTNKKDDDDDKEVGGIGRLFARFFGAAEENGLEFTTPDKRPKPSIYGRDDMKPIDFDAMDKRIADAVNFDLANPLPSMNFKDDEYAASTYDEVQPLEGADTYKARRITAQGINDTIKGLMDTEQRQADIKQAVNKTIESLRSADPEVPYVIQAGDTLSDIAAKTGTTVKDLVKVNGIKDKEKIYTGNELIIPTDKTTMTKQDVVSSLIEGMSGYPKMGESFEGEGVEVASAYPLANALPSLQPDVSLEDAIITRLKTEEGIDYVAEKKFGEKFYTIGHGHYGADVKEGQTITAKEADALLRKDLAKRMPKIKSKIKNFDNLSQELQVEIAQSWFRGGIAGSPKTIKLINEGKFEEASVEFLDNNEYRTTKLRGVKRRMKGLSDTLKKEANR